MKARKLKKCRRHIKFVSSLDHKENIVDKSQFLKDIIDFMREEDPTNLPIKSKSKKKIDDSSRDNKDFYEFILESD